MALYYIAGDIFSELVIHRLFRNGVVIKLRSVISFRSEGHGAGLEKDAK